jgi:DNA repair exonuclease SbcCD nuclease subunit
MKLLFASDFHLSSKNPVGRLDDLVVTQFEKLAFILGLARKQDAIVVQAGDLFTRPRSWFLLPQVIHGLKLFNVPFYCVFGQHDTYMYSEETRERTSLGVLEKAGLVTVLSDVPTVPKNKILFYGASYGQELPEPKETGFKVGVIHASISDKALWPDHKFTPAKKYLAANKYDVILCGDVHSRFVYRDVAGRMIVNTGPILRREANEYNFKNTPAVMLYDTDTRNGEWFDVPCQSPNIVLSRDHIERSKEAETLLDEFVNLVKAGGEFDAGVSFIDNLREFLKANIIEAEVVSILAKIVEKSGEEGL